jgi:PhnB protein
MKNPIVESYLFFGGRCEEAIAFYRGAIGAEMEMLMRFDQCPDPLPEGMLAPGFEKKVMHASLRIGETRVMVADGCGGEGDSKAFDGFSLSLSLGTEEDAANAFRALAEGGTVTMPLGQTFWSPCFGMVTDRFGVGWMVTVAE